MSSGSGIKPGQVQCADLRYDVCDLTADELRGVDSCFCCRTNSDRNHARRSDNRGYCAAVWPDHNESSDVAAVGWRTRRGSQN